MKTIRELRLEAGLTQTQLAFKVGVSTAVISRMELGKPVLPAYVKIVCDGLNVSVNEVEGVVVYSALAQAQRRDEKKRRKNECAC